jgi:hypothetical protein
MVPVSRSLLVVPLLVALLPVSLQGQAKVYDDFNTGNKPMEALWDWDALTTVSQSGGLLHIATPPNGVAARLSSTHGFRGDFDFVLDVRNFKSTATKFQNGAPSLLLEVRSEENRVGHYVQLARVFDSQGHAVLSNAVLTSSEPAPTRVSLSASATAGRLRISRTASAITTWYDFGSGWKVVQTYKGAFNAIVRVSIRSYSGDDGGFTADSDQITYDLAEMLPPPQSYGTACHGLGIFEGGLANLGNKNFGVGVDGAPALANLWFLLGISDKKWSGQNLPFDLAPMGAPSCYLLNSMEILVSGLKADGNGVFLLPAPIPNDARLVGVTVYCQYVAEDRSKNAWGLVWSDGLAVKILK